MIGVAEFAAAAAAASAIGSFSTHNERYKAGWRPLHYKPGWEWNYELNRFQRTRAAKEERMTRFVEWKRRKIFERRRIHVLVALGLLLGTPLALTVLSWAWRAAIASIAQ